MNETTLFVYIYIYNNNNNNSNNVCVEREKERERERLYVARGVKFNVYFRNPMLFIKIQNM